VRVRNLLLLRHRSPPLEYVAADEEATNPATVAEADELCEPPTAEDLLAAGAFLREETMTSPAFPRRDEAADDASDELTRTWPKGV
jgi:hypothetical protein